MLQNQRNKIGRCLFRVVNQLFAGERNGIDVDRGKYAVSASDMQSGKKNGFAVGMENHSGTSSPAVVMCFRNEFLRFQFFGVTYDRAFIQTGKR